MDYLSNFVENINDYLSVTNQSINKFAKKIGVSQGTVSKWLSFKSFPSLQTAEKVADLFNCSLDFLFGMTKTEKINRALIRTTFIERFKELVKTSSKTEYQIARICKIEQSTISKWHRGKYPKIETLINLSKLFNCSIDFLVGRSNIT